MGSVWLFAQILQKNILPKTEYLLSIYSLFSFCERFTLFCVHLHKLYNNEGFKILGVVFL